MRDLMDTKTFQIVHKLEENYKRRREHLFLVDVIDYKPLNEWKTKLDFPEKLAMDYYILSRYFKVPLREMKISEWIVDKADKFKGWLSKRWDQIKEAVAKAAAKAKDIVKGIVDLLIETGKSVLGSKKEKEFKKMAEDIAKKKAKSFDEEKEFVNTDFSDLKEKLIGGAKDGASALKNMSEEDLINASNEMNLEDNIEKNIEISESLSLSGSYIEVIRRYAIGEYLGEKKISASRMESVVAIPVMSLMGNIIKEKFKWLSKKAEPFINTAETAVKKGAKMLLDGISDFTGNDHEYNVMPLVIAFILGTIFELGLGAMVLGGVSGPAFTALKLGSGIGGVVQVAIVAMLNLSGPVKYIFTAFMVMLSVIGGYGLFLEHLEHASH